jgi:predicted CXXCH cytochrome family protein
MHFSQNGQAPLFQGQTSVGPNAGLLLTDCVGCHSNTLGSETIYQLGDSPVPSVFNPGGGLQYPANGSSNSTLAGGNFFWVADQGDAFGHNVFGIAGMDAAHSANGAPGGLGTAAAPGTTCYNCHFTLATADYGCEGCHLADGAHHAEDGQAGVASRGDGWYRFLGNVMLENLDEQGVEGVEDPLWEQNVSPTQHNVYKGTTDDYQSVIVLANNSIGELCAGCHAKFHHVPAIGGVETDGMRNTVGAGAWIRHPSDVVLPADGDYAAYTTYDPLAPIAKQTLDGTVTSVVVPGEDVVTCISCHRAHGSPYPDMLRWDYTNDCSAGSDDTEANPCGCFTCHTTKDAM